jgi:hypothetical protein
LPCWPWVVTSCFKINNNQLVKFSVPAHRRSVLSQFLRWSRE